MAAPVLHKRLPELAALERVLKVLETRARVEIPATIQHKGMDFPLHTIVVGTEDKTAPTIGVFGGVHGLERIGSEVVVAYLHVLNEALNWDETLHERLKRSRMVFMPLVNPVGMFHMWRSNGNGIDLMRNAPVVADEAPAFLVGGQKFSNILPWYRGDVSRFEDMEIEAQALCRLVEDEIFQAKTSLTIDVHSGFGSVDRLWFPYAKTRKPPRHLPEITALKRLFDRTYPNHFYRIEPQAKQYTTHGDLWDYLYDLHQLRHPGNVFLPWTLELGSWLWLKKNPVQLFSSLGPFNPLKPHRLQRILRRHLTLFDFLHRALIAPASWTELDEDSRRELTHEAMDLWYEP